MREIGSEFWDVPTTDQPNNLFPEFTQWFLSGRSALQTIIKELGGRRSVSVPSWCCDSMIKPFLDAGMEVEFYPVFFDNGLVQQIDMTCDVLFLMDYFGSTMQSPVLSDYKGVVIRDVTHSVFGGVSADADYYFGSLRKWCGVWTGGYAWAQDAHPLRMERNDAFAYITLREEAMQLKESYIYGRGIMDKGYLKVFEKAEGILEKTGIAPAADRDVMLAHRLDVGFMRKQRRANARVLMDAFPDWLIFRELKPSECPMFVPVCVPNGRREELRRFLIRNEIYCPVHWPVSEHHKLTEREQFLYDNELSLVCDHRYTEEDMRRMVQIIELFMGE